MFFKQSTAFPLYGFTSFQQEGLLHYVSSRHGGVSQGELSSLNISFSVGDDPSNVQENRARIAQAMQVQDSQLVFGRQTHEDKVGLLTPEIAKLPAHQLAEQYFQGTDALITNAAGVCLSVTTADCVPVLLFDPVKRAIGAVHAGWKGTVAMIAQKAALAMQQHFGTQAQDLWVAIGPSAGPERYEVGQEVADAFEAAFSQTAGIVIWPFRGEKPYINLWEANKRQLEAIGVPSHQIDAAGVCTITQHHEFFSARHYKGKGGRFASGLVLRY